MSLFVYTVIYAFFGWLIEVSYYLYKTKTFVNRGFLNGPFVPIYGLSLISLHLLLFHIFENFSPVTWVMILSVFIFIIVIGTLFELIGGMILFNVFEARWWDYSDQPFNYKGYVCLPFSLIWGVMGTLGFFLLHVQFIVPLVENLSLNLLRMFTLVMGTVLFIDYVFTLYSLFNFKRLILEFKTHAGEFNNYTQRIRTKLPLSLSQALDSLRNNETFIGITYRLNRAKNTVSDLRDKFLSNEYSRLSKVSHKIRQTRLYKAFPNLKILQREEREKDE